nr:glycoside hydrolase family 16 protein [uncultured Carboxylicivirga sp.]
MKGKTLHRISIIALIILTGIVSGCQPKDNYQLVWSDEFNYEGLPDSTKWSYDTEGNAWGWGNNELQTYTSNNLRNAEVIDGNLVITAVKEDSIAMPYTSARLITKGKGDWLYGKVEVKAKVPGGKGIWPAIWMLPTDWEYGGWPASGEIDIMEHVGYEPDSVYFTVHTEAYNHSIGTQKSQPVFAPDVEYSFHKYGMEWTPKKIDFFLDDNKVFTFKNENATSAEWPYDKRFHLLMNVAVGGGWGGKHGVDNTIFPCRMLVDYVRVYQLK